MKSSIGLVMFAVMVNLLATTAPALAKTFECEAMGATKSGDIFFEIRDVEHFTLYDHARGIEDNRLFGSAGKNLTTGKFVPERLAARIMGEDQFILEIGGSRDSVGMDVMTTRFDGKTVEVDLYRPWLGGARLLRVICAAIQ